MKLYFIAGEASGDLHGSNLIRAIREIHPDAEIRGWGGDLMHDAGAHIVKHYRELAFMGFLEVVMNLTTILRNMRWCKEDIATWKPDAVIFIDYPGFNLRIAEWAHQQDIRTFYYISPQIWAWKEKRVHQIIRDVDHMCVVLPFEKAFYEKYHHEVEFVGHPLLDAISSKPVDATEFRSAHGLDSRPIVAILPGSRKQEISTMLPLMLSAQTQFVDYQFVIAAAPSLEEEVYRRLIQASGAKVKIVRGKTHELLAVSRAGLVTSGTATLEAGLIGMPQVVCYKGNPVSYWIARRLVKVKYISLVNLILDRTSVTELIQNDLNPARIKNELEVLLHDTPERSRVLSDYTELRTKLGGTGASMRTAKALLKSLTH